MRNKKNTLLVLLLLLWICFMGCGKRENGVEESKPEEKTVITIWTKDRHDAAYQEARINEYNDRNEDNIVVEYRIYSDNYVQALDSAFQSNSGPDLIAYSDRVFNQFYAQGRFADMMPYMDQKFRETYESVMIEGVNVFDGHCYFIPTTATTSRLFYNKTLLERAGITTPPTTMDELIDAARIITSLYSDEGIYGFAINLSSAQMGLDRTLMKQANRAIGIKCGYDFAAGRYDFSGYEVLLEKWRILLSEECAYPLCRELDIDPLRQMFAHGKIGMYISYIHAEQGVYQQQFPMEEEWGCAEIPMIDGTVVGAQNYSLNGGFLFNQNSKHLEETWKVYLALFADLDYQTEYYENGFGVSVIPQVLEAAAEDGYVPKYDTLMLSERDRMWPKAPHEENPDAVILDGLDFYEVFKELLYNKQRISTALDDLTVRYNEAYRQGIAQGEGTEIKIPYFDPMNP